MTDSENIETSLMHPPIKHKLQ
uniref:Uncharacterized protein n=1 Tax=Rhizophora mucronata TaxID=61149 RepID=A0A2P2PRA9_RHIMU